MWLAVTQYYTIVFLNRIRADTNRVYATRTRTYIRARARVRAREKLAFKTDVIYRIINE